MRWIWLALFLLACGDDAAIDDAGVEDAPARDSSLADSSLADTSLADTADLDAPSLDAPGLDASTDAPTLDEDCATDADEDLNGYAGCLDPVCWSEVRCVDAELAENDVSGWSACGETVELSAAETQAFCEAGIPFPSERDFDCGRLPTTIQLDVFCEPAEGPGRALRYRVDMDLTSEDEPLGPMSTRHTSFMYELIIGNVYIAFGGGASSGSEPTPTTEAWMGERYRSSGWIVAQSGSHVIVLLGASARTSTFTVLEDGGFSSSSSDPVLFVNAGLDAML